MPTVAIDKHRASGSLPERLWKEFNEITENVRRRAFDLFERRGGTSSLDLQNWFDAEREVVWSPASEVIENDGAYSARIALPGFQPRDLQVVATPDALIVETEKNTYT